MLLTPLIFVDMKPGNTRPYWLRQLFTFRLSSLFILITLIAVGTTLYLRAEKRARICTELHGLGCPVVRSGSLSATEMEKRFYEANLGAISPNEMAWSGFAPAVCGAWESKRFTVLVDFGAVTPIALFEGSRIRSLIAQLDGVDTVVIGAVSYTHLTLPTSDLV